MLGYTHVAVGATTALLYTNMQGMGINSELIVPIVVGSIGGLVPDVDMYDTDDESKNLKKRIKYIVIVMVLLMGLFWLLHEQLNLDLLISSICIFILMIIICNALSAHRHVSHSLLAMGIFTYSLIRIHKDLGMMFMLAYASHLLLDIINYKRVHLFSFIPKLKKGICLKLVKADNPVVNSVITGMAIFLSFFILLLMSKN